VESTLLPPTPGRPSIDFRQARDAGGVINTSFEFLRENWRGLLRAVVFIAGPVVLVVLALQTLLLSTESFVLNGILSVAQRVIFVTLMQTLIFGYILLYNEHGRDGVTITDLRSLVASDVGAVFVVIALSMLASIFAGVLLLIPGIYLFVATSLSAPVRMAEDSTAGSAISRSMELVRDHWWQTFGIIVLILIVAMLLSVIVQLPAWLLMLFSFEALASSAMEGTGVLGVIMTLVDVISVIIASLLIDTAVAAQYFSLVEHKEGPGMLARIEQIGVTPDDDVAATSSRPTL
jgi:hypothetical protein